MPRIIADVGRDAPWDQVLGRAQRCFDFSRERAAEFSVSGSSGYACNKNQRGWASHEIHSSDAAGSSAPNHLAFGFLHPSLLIGDADGYATRYITGASRDAVSRLLG